jgi:hypothetical protein
VRIDIKQSYKPNSVRGFLVQYVEGIASFDGAIGQDSVVEESILGIKYPLSTS